MAMAQRRFGFGSFSGIAASGSTISHVIGTLLYEVHMRKSPRHSLAAHGVAFVADAESLLLRWILCPGFGDARPFMAFFPAVIHSTRFRARGPGMGATHLGAAAGCF